MCKSKIGIYDHDYIHLADSLNEDAAMMAVEKSCLDDKPATRSTQALAATNFKGPLRGGTGKFVNKATDLELKKLRSCIQNEKILRQKAETELRQNEKMAVRLERQVDHSATKMRKSNDNAEKLVAQAQAKTDDVQAKNKQLKENLEVKIFLPQPHAPHESFCGYTSFI